MRAMPEVVTGVFLGFDYGSKRIGVAVGNILTGSAQALTTLHHANGPDWEQLEALVKEWRPQAMVVGLPLKQDGSEQPMTRRARGFCDALHKHFNLPVHESDERFSSIEAEVRLREQRASGQRKRRVSAADTDAIAAQIILESWLENQTT